MERFVFVAAVAIAIIFGIGAVFGGRDGFHFTFDDEGGGTAEIVAVAPGRMEPQAFAGTNLRIKSTAATVTIVPEDRTDFLIEIDNSSGRAPMPIVSAEDGRVTIDGQLRGRISNCRDESANLRGYGDIPLAELPRVTIRAPRGLVIDRSGAGTTEIGASDSLDLDMSGCADAAIGDVAGQIDLDISGASDVTVGAVGSFSADIAGAGDLTIASVANGADLDVSGAGDVTFTSLTGELNADAAGAATIRVLAGAITTADLDLAGAGDVEIAAPIQSLTVAVMGVGTVDVRGTVGDLDVDIAGPGTVRVDAVTGTLRQEVAGPGSVQIGSRETNENAP